MNELIGKIVEITATHLAGQQGVVVQVSPQYNDHYVRVRAANGMDNWLWENEYTVLDNETDPNLTEITVSATVVVPTEWAWVVQDSLEEALKDGANVAALDIETQAEGLQVAVAWDTEIG